MLSISYIFPAFYIPYGNFYSTSIVSFNTYLTQAIRKV